jgi:hypothetical protein
MTAPDHVNAKPGGKSALDAALGYALRGWRVFPVHSTSKAHDGSIRCTCGDESCGNVGKHPWVTGWVDRASADRGAVALFWKAKPQANVGVVMGPASGLVDIECDPRNGGDDSFLELVDELGPLPHTTSFRSGGGGVHRLFKAPDGRALKKKRGWRKGVDVLCGDNSFAVMPPSRHRSGKVYEWLDACEPAELPEAWILALEMRGGEKPAGETGAGALTTEALLAHAGSDKPGDQYSLLGDHAVLLGRHGWELDHTDGVNEHWTRPGKTGGTSATWHTERRIFYPFTSSIEGLEADKGYSLFSLRGMLDFGGDYAAAAAAVRSEGFGPPMADDEDGEAPTPEAIERRVIIDKDKMRRAAYAVEFERADSRAALDEVVERVRAAELTDATRDELAYCYRDAAKARGQKFTLSACRAALLDPVADQHRAVDRAKREGWLEGWAYSQEGPRGSWYNCETGHALSVSVFDTTNAARLLSDLMRAEGKVSPPWLPTAWAINLGLAPVVAGVRYCPGRPPMYRDESVGGTFANTWRGYDPADVLDPMMAEPEELEAVNTWRMHFLWLLGDEAATLLIQFLAWVTQHPERRPHWCYTIIGPEGIGKSAIMWLMGTVLGHKNVGTVSTGDLAEPKYNAWATGAQLRAIEELMIAFQKRETQRTLMDAIGNDTIRVVTKGEDAYQADNYTAYLAFTNSRNPLILSENDRRYYLTTTTHADKGFVDDLGGPAAAKAYFDRLFAARDDRWAPVLRGWLLNIDLTGFDPMRAPMSQAKLDLVDASRSDHETTIRELIASEAEEAQYVTAGAIGLETLKALMPGVSGQAIGRELREMGFELTNPLRLDGENSMTRWAVQRTVMGKAGIRYNDKSPVIAIRAWFNEASTKRATGDRKPER